MICSILEDRSLQTRGGIVVRKIRFFFKNFALFMPKNDARIGRELTLVFRRLNKELYSRQELMQFKKLKDQLEPSAKDVTRIRSCQNYIPLHSCNKSLTASKDHVFNYDIFEVIERPALNF